MSSRHQRPGGGLALLGIRKDATTAAPQIHGNSPSGGLPLRGLRRRMCHTKQQVRRPGKEHVFFGVRSDSLHGECRDPAASMPMVKNFSGRPGGLGGVHGDEVSSLNCGLVVPAMHTCEIPVSSKSAQCWPRQSGLQHRSLHA
uniref:Uncharacterized protein n=1 Tax=Arundo donax TaxID=35708 RepID=A0A0A9BP49_ARUDO